MGNKRAKPVTEKKEEKVIKEAKGAAGKGKKQ